MNQMTETKPDPLESDEYLTLIQNKDAYTPGAFQYELAEIIRTHFVPREKLDEANAIIEECRAALEYEEPDTITVTLSKEDWKNIWCNFEPIAERKALVEAKKKWPELVTGLGPSWNTEDL